MNDSVNKTALILMVILLFFMHACATLEKSEVETVPDTRPQISKTLTQKAPIRFLKHKVAISRFSNETKYGQSFLLDENMDRIGKQAMDILSARLASTDKFILLERSDLEKIHQELKRGGLERHDVVADYLIIGSISEFGRKTTGKVGIFSRTKKQTAYSRVNVRLVDIYTGQVIYAEEGYGEASSEAGSVFGVGARAGFDSTLNDKAISAAISKLINNLIENLLDKPWRAYILGRENGQYMISGGRSQGIVKGDTFGIYRKGKRIKNPQTGMDIELPGSLVAKIQISDFLGEKENEISLGWLIDGSLSTDDFSELYIQALEEGK